MFALSNSRNFRERKKGWILCSWPLCF